MNNKLKEEKERLNERIKKADSRSYLGDYSERDMLASELKGENKILSIVKEIIDDFIEDKRKKLKEEDGIDINEWWSSEILTGLDIEELKNQLEEKNGI